MQHNYTKPNLMNQVNVPPAAFTSLASDRLSLFWGSNRGFHSLQSVQHWWGVGVGGASVSDENCPNPRDNQPGSSNITLFVSFTVCLQGSVTF